VKLLLQQNASVDVKDKSFSGTPLGWALHARGESRPGRKRDRYYEVVALLVAAGATVGPGWLNESDRGFPPDRKIRDDPRMLAALKA
jgi:hypothetical protein